MIRVRLEMPIDGGSLLVQMLTADYLWPGCWTGKDGNQVLISDTPKGENPIRVTEMANRIAADIGSAAAIYEKAIQQMPKNQG